MRCGDLVFERFVLQLFAKVVFAGATALDLHKLGRRKHRAHQRKVEQVGAVVTGGHHAHGDAHAGFAGLVGGQAVGRAQQRVVGEIDGELLRICDAGRDLHGKVRLVATGEHGMRLFVEDLRELGRMGLADGEDDGLAKFSADGIAQAVLQQRFAKQLVGGF